VTNLCDGSYTNADHTAYTFDNEKNLAALELLLALDGISFAPEMVGGDEIAMFRNGRLQMAFCWNITQQALNDGKTDNGDEIMFLAFPSDDGKPELQGGVWGFGVFDNGDESKIAAAKAFIEFVCMDNAERAAEFAGYFPVSADVTGAYKGDALMTEYNKLSKYFGDYYQVTPNWGQSRSAWWNMLQDIGEGTDITEAAAVWNLIANDGLN
jgi:multiple sugar transport system substrate-binding protein